MVPPRVPADAGLEAVAPPALYATLALLFDGFSREAAGGAKADELQRLRRYGKAYLDLNGPNRQIVERWLRYLDSHAGG